jgi:hypothetical protein
MRLNHSAMTGPRPSRTVREPGNALPELDAGRVSSHEFLREAESSVRGAGRVDSVGELGGGGLQALPQGELRPGRPRSR